MSDWKNQIGNIVNKIKQQLHAKKLDDLESVRKWVSQFDENNNGKLDKYEFQKLLSKIGIFLTTQELRSIYNHYDYNQDGSISYSEFIELIRTSISEKRLAVVKHAFQYIDQQNKGTISLQELFQKFQAQEHPRVKSRQKSVEQVREEFENTISKKSQDNQSITEQEFLDYYVDCNATLPEEREEYFMTLLLNCWAVTAAEDYVSPERLADLEIILFEKIRQKTNTNQDEGKAIRKAFKLFDLNDSGVVNMQQFTKVLEIFGCIFSQKEIAAIFNKYDKQRTGRFQYEDFCGLIATIGAGNNSNVKPVFFLESQVPKETLERIKKELRRQNRGVEFIGMIFEKSDKNQNGTLDRDEFIWAMRECGFQLTNTEYKNLFKYFDRQNDNAIRYNDFIQILQ